MPHDPPLRAIHPFYAHLQQAVRDELASKDVPALAKQFELTADHELPVLHALESLLSADARAFLGYHPDDGGERVAEDTFLKYHRLACEAPFLLRCALLLHDLGKGRDVPEPHSESGADLVCELGAAILRALRPYDPAADQATFDTIVWLIRHHDLLGNIYTGEREPTCLVDALGNQPNRELCLRLLQVMIVCDLRGTKDGRYLTESRAGYWLSLCDEEAVRRQVCHLFQWHVERWTGSLVGTKNVRKAEDVMRLLDRSGCCDAVGEVFGNRVSRVLYGFYLFTELSAEELARLMISVARLWQGSALRPEKFVLAFELYRPWDSGTRRVLQSYRNQLAAGRLDSSWENATLAIHAGPLEDEAITRP